jgi:CubicO group peptidase (beta-lactamase class C family)
MKRLLTTACLFVVTAIATVSFIAAAVFGQEQNATKASPSPAESVIARVDKLFAPWNRSDSPGCSLGVSQNGVLVYERGYGMANLEYGIAITPASIFEVASISEQFTAMAILILAQRGKLSLDDDVRKYITEMPDYGNRITLRHLLTHTSGLRNGLRLLQLTGRRDGDGMTNDDVVKILARQKVLNFTPGTEFLYSNGFGYTLLAVIVKRVSGQSLRAFADANIFKPLGMAHTHFHDDPTMIVPNRASGYYVGSGNELRSMSEVDLQHLQLANQPGGDIAGQSHLYTTTRDLLIWEQNFADVRVGDPALVAAMETPTVLTGGDTSFYGFGIQVRWYRGLREFGHGGSEQGWDLRVVRYPDQGLAVAVLCNLENISSSRLARGVADIYLEKFFPLPAASSATAAPPNVSLSAEQLASKVGLYRNPLNDDLRRISVRDGKLWANIINDATGGAELRPVGENRFLLPWGTAVEFVPGVAGRAQDLRELPDGQRPLMFGQVTAFAPSSTELRAFAGEYTSSELEVTYTLVPRDSGLLLQLPRGTSHLLRPTFTDAFQEDRIGVEFTRDARGGVTGLLLHYTANGRSEVRGLRFDRVKR